MKRIPFLVTTFCYLVVGSALSLASCEYKIPDVDPTNATGGSGGMVSSSASGGFGGNNNTSSSGEMTSSSQSSASSSGSSGNFCGDGIQGDNEACDDGNLRQGDGCSPECLIEDHDGCGVPVLVLKPNEAVVISSTTENAFDDVQRSVVLPCALADRFGPDVIYAVTPTAPGLLTATMVAEFDTHYLHIRTDCPGMDSSEIACDFGYMTSKPDIATIPLQVGMVYFVIADGHANAGGKFTLSLVLSP